MMFLISWWSFIPTYPYCQIWGSQSPPPPPPPFCKGRGGGLGFELWHFIISFLFSFYVLSQLHTTDFNNKVASYYNAIHWRFLSSIDMPNIVMFLILRWSFICNSLTKNSRQQFFYYCSMKQMPGPFCQANLVAGNMCSGRKYRKFVNISIILYRCYAVDCVFKTVISKL